MTRRHVGVAFAIALALTPGAASVALGVLALSGRFDRGAATATSLAIAGLVATVAALTIGFLFVSYQAAIPVHSPALAIRIIRRRTIYGFLVVAATTTLTGLGYALWEISNTPAMFWLLAGTLFTFVLVAVLLWTTPTRIDPLPLIGRNLRRSRDVLRKSGLRAWLDSEEIRQAYSLIRILVGVSDTAGLARALRGVRELLVAERQAIAVNVLSDSYRDIWLLISYQWGANLYQPYLPKNIHFEAVRTLADVTGVIVAATGRPSAFASVVRYAADRGDFELIRVAAEGLLDGAEAVTHADADREVEGYAFGQAFTALVSAVAANDRSEEYLATTQDLLMGSVSRIPPQQRRRFCAGVIRGVRAPADQPALRHASFGTGTRELRRALLALCRSFDDERECRRVIELATPDPDTAGRTREETHAAIARLAGS